MSRAAKNTCVSLAAAGFLLFFVVFPAYAQTASNQIDLIIEADTHTPYFYKGRTLPVANEVFRATALTHGADPSALTYTWKLNNTILFGGPVRGLNNPVITAPEREGVLSVTVESSSGTLGAVNVMIDPAEPELYFYEDNPLRSTSRQAIQDTFTLVGEEVTVRAEPYFVASDIFRTDPTITWTLDGREIQNFGNDPQSITLRGTGERGDARIGFKLINAATLQYLQDAFTIHFES